jgi:exodeoxyribonuclease-3
MRLITWNCNMAFRKKAEHILPFQPDILVVPECEHPDKLLFPKKLRQPTSIFWFGKNRNKGLGVCAYNNFKLELHPSHDARFETILPLSVSNGVQEFTLFAIWANNPTDPDGQYVTQVWKAIQHYDDLIRGTNTILLGDFNSNTIWDKPRRKGNHSDVVKKLEEKNIHSAYHRFHRQTQGRERHPTLFLYRHRDKPYHLDYCFASADIVDGVTSVRVGSYRKWSALSDHVPLIVTVER